MATVTLNPTADAPIRSNSPTSNFGNDNLVVGELNDQTGYVRRSLLRFDIPLVSNAIVQSATLRLYQNTDYSSNARDFRVYRLLRAWVENQVTWNVYSTGNSWQTAGGFGANDCEQTAIGTRTMSASEATGYKEWALDTAAIQGMMRGTFTNNGFLVKADTEANDAYEYNSREDASNKPELVIVYELGGRQFQAVIIG